MTADPQILYAAVLAADARLIARRMGGKMGALPEFHGGQAKTAEENADIVLASIKVGCYSRAKIHQRQKITIEAVDRALALLLAAGRITSQRGLRGTFRYEAVAE